MKGGKVLVLSTQHNKGQDQFHSVATFQNCFIQLTADGPGDCSVCNMFCTAGGHQNTDTNREMRPPSCSKPHHSGGLQTESPAQQPAMQHMQGCRAPAPCPHLRQLRQCLPLHASVRPRRQLSRQWSQLRSESHPLVLSALAGGNGKPGKRQQEGGRAV